MSGVIQVCPGANLADPADMLAKCTFWAGNDPSGSGLKGTWMKKCWIGGTSPANAPLVVDVNGVVSWVNVASAVTINIDPTNGFRATGTNSYATLADGYLNIFGTGTLAGYQSGLTPVACIVTDPSGNVFSATPISFSLWIASTTVFSCSVSGGVTKLKVAGLPSYANNAAALAGGLVAGEAYLVAGSDPRALAIVY